MILNSAGNSKLSLDIYDYSIRNKSDENINWDNRNHSYVMFPIDDCFRKYCPSYMMALESKQLWGNTQPTVIDKFHDRTNNNYELMCSFQWSGSIFLLGREQTLFWADPSYMAPRKQLYLRGCQTITKFAMSPIILYNRK